MQKVFMVLELCKGGELSKVWKEKGCFMEEVCYCTNIFY